MINLQRKNELSLASAEMLAASGDNQVAYFKNARSYNLSRQELKILQCLTCGDPNKIIAHQLGITEATVKAHVRTVLRKLDTTNRTKAAILAISEGLVPASKKTEAQAARA